MSVERPGLKRLFLMSENGSWSRAQNSTSVTGLNPDRADFLMVPHFVMSKPVTENKRVEKKIKQRGWSKQFYEK